MKYPALPFWSVGCRLFMEKSKPYRVPFPEEAEAMGWANETSLMPEYSREIISVARHDATSSGFITAEYLNGEEQSEKLALDRIILDCKIFAEYRAKSAANPLTVLVMIGIAALAWASGVAWLANLIGLPFGIIIAFVIVSAAIIALANKICRKMQKGHEIYLGESVKWAREVVHTVMKTDPSLRERILNTRRNKSKPLPWTEDMVEKFEKEIRALERAGFE